MRTKNAELMHDLRMPLQLICSCGQLLRFARVDLISRTWEICARCQLYAGRKDIRLGFHANADRLELALDEEKYTRILMNLLSNALKFTPEGGRVRVQVRALWAAGAVAALVLFVPLPLPQEVCDLLLGVAAFLLLHALGRALPKGAYRVIRPLAGAAYAVFLIHHVLLFIVFRPRVALPLTRPRAFLLCAVYLVATFAAGTLLSTVWARVLAFWQRRGRRPAT